ncbi:MAG TPA: ABC transporter permease [Blastocatellia bacterium]|nr:ABC transporter permease [Blastocatellia bacterium]
MKFLESLKLAASAIWAHKLRSFLTLLGIIFGVAVVILVVTIIEGFNNYVEEKVADLGSNAFVVTRFGIITSEKEFREKEQYNRAVTTGELGAITAHKVFVREAAAVTRRRAPVKFGSKELQDIRIAGASANLIDIDTMKVGEGRFYTREEDEQRASVAFLGADIARDLFPMVDPIGQEIKIDGRPYRVIGVAAAIGTVFGQPQDAFIDIPIGTFLKTYGSNSGLALRVSAISADHMQDAVDEVRVTLRSRRHLSPDQKDNFDILTPDAINKLRDQMFGTISIVAIGVTSIALVVGGIVVMNIMLVSVTERTREIGIRKSLGARRSDILQQFLAESTLLSLLGGLIGVLAAWSLSKVVTLLLSFPTTLPVMWTMIALGVSAGVGVFFGIYPAWRAAKLDPIIALRAD